MKVSQAIRILTHNYQPNDDIIANRWGYELYDEDINEEYPELEDDGNKD